MLDTPELARRWNVPESWIREYSRDRYDDPIPHFKLGTYLRYLWGSKELTEWLERRKVGGIRRVA